MAPSERRGTLKLGVGSVAVDAPSQFGGPGQGINPEELLVSSAATCYGLTLAALLERARLVPKRLEIEAEGIVLRERGLVFQQMVMRPSIVLEGADADRCDEAARLCTEAEEKCFIARTLRPTVPYVLESDVTFAR